MDDDSFPGSDSDNDSVLSLTPSEAEEAAAKERAAFKERLVEKSKQMWRVIRQAFLCSVQERVAGAWSDITQEAQAAHALVEAGKVQVEEPSDTVLEDGTVVKAKRKPVSMEKQGNLDHYSELALLRRRWMRKDPRVAKALYKHWNAITAHRAIDNKILRRPVYVRFFAVLHEMLLPKMKMEFEDRRRAVVSEWASDSAGNPHMEYQQFFNAMFTLVDMWTDHTDIESYVEFSDELFKRVDELAKSGAWEAAENDPDGWSHSPDGRLGSAFYCSACQDLKRGMKPLHPHNFVAWPHNLRAYESFSSLPMLSASGHVILPMGALHTFKRSASHLARCESCRLLYLRELEALEAKLRNGKSASSPTGTWRAFLQGELPPDYGGHCCHHDHGHRHRHHDHHHHAEEFKSEATFEAPVLDMREIRGETVSTALDAIDRGRDHDLSRPTTSGSGITVSLGRRQNSAVQVSPPVSREVSPARPGRLAPFDEGSQQPMVTKVPSPAFVDGDSWVELNSVPTAGEAGLPPKKFGKPAILPPVQPTASPPAQKLPSPTARRAHAGMSPVKVGRALQVPPPVPTTVGADPLVVRPAVRLSPVLVPSQSPERRYPSFTAAAVAATSPTPPSFDPLPSPLSEPSGEFVEEAVAFEDEQQGSRVANVWRRPRSPADLAAPTLSPPRSGRSSPLPVAQIMMPPSMPRSVGPSRPPSPLSGIVPTLSPPSSHRVALLAPSADMLSAASVTEPRVPHYRANAPAALYVKSNSTSPRVIGGHAVKSLPPLSPPVSRPGTVPDFDPFGKPRRRRGVGPLNATTSVSPVVRSNSGLSPPVTPAASTVSSVVVAPFLAPQGSPPKVKAMKKPRSPVLGRGIAAPPRSLPSFVLSGVQVPDNNNY